MSLERDLVGTAPNRCWVADFTYVKTHAEVVYVACVVDTFTRRVVGWSASYSKETQFVLDALETALWPRDCDGEGHRCPEPPRAPLRRRSQDTSFVLAEHLNQAGIAASIGTVGDASDNALMESTIGLYKTELVEPHRSWTSLTRVELATVEWTDWYTAAASRVK